jgi:integrase
MDSYVFWAEKSSSKPMESVLFIKGLRDALEKIGMPHDSASIYVFHGWRHFFTAYMRDRLNEKLLQSQTGHKTVSMLDHYSMHRLSGDRERIRQAQQDVFGALIPMDNDNDVI